MRYHNLFVARLLLCVCVFAGFGPFSSQTTVAQQISNPIKIVEITSADKQVNLERPFENGDNWLEDFKIKLKNVSDKTVVYVNIQFHFPEVSARGDELSFRTELGNLPGVASNAAQMALKPNQEKNFLLNKTEYQALARFVKDRRRSSEMNRVDIQIGLVVFSDSSGYLNGRIVKPDPANPGRWIPY